MKELVKQIVDITSDLDELIKTIKQKTELYEQDIKDLVESKKAKETEIQSIKDQIEPKVLQEFNETKNKKYCGGIGVQERSELTYDEVKVFEWALDKKLFLQLDKKSFEKVAESIGAPTVKVEKKAKVTYPKTFVLED